VKIAAETGIHTPCFRWNGDTFSIPTACVRWSSTSSVATVLCVHGDEPR